MYLNYNCFLKILMAAFHKHRKDRSLLVKKGSAKICMNKRNQNQYLWRKTPCSLGACLNQKRWLYPVDLALSCTMGISWEWIDKEYSVYTNKEVNYETTRDCCLIYDLTNHLRNIIVKIWKENNCSWNLKNNTKLKIQIKCRLLIQPNRTRFFMIIYENSCMQLLMVKQR